MKTGKQPSVKTARNGRNYYSHGHPCPDCGTSLIRRECSQFILRCPNCRTDRHLFLRRDYIGQVYGRLRIIAYAHKDERRRPFFHCSCSCGNTRIVRLDRLKDGSTRSCGCYRRETTRLQGLSNTIPRYHLHHEQARITESMHLAALNLQCAMQSFNHSDALRWTPVDYTVRLPI